MTTEDPPSNNSSPRLSFSQDLIQPNNPFSSPPKPVNSPNSESDFNFSIEISATQDHSPADEIFFNGKILPLPLRNPNPILLPNPDPIAVPANEKSSGGKKSLWKFGRSASLNCARTGMIKIKFLRSYSTGSDSNPKPHPHPNPKPRPAKSPKRGYYFEGDKRGVCGNGANRLSPVPLFPKQRGLIGFLMCNCVGGNNKGMDC